MPDVTLKNVDIKVNDPTVSGGIKSFDINNTKIPNLANGTENKDAINLSQLNATVTEITTPVPDATIKLIDRAKAAGYGVAGIIKYFSLPGENVNIEPDRAFSATYFVQKASGAKEGFLLMHQDLLSPYISNIEDKSSIGFVPSDDFEFSVSYYSTTAPSGTKWNYQGASIPSADLANNPTPPRYSKSNGDIVNSFEEANKAVYSPKSGYFKNSNAVIKRGWLQKKNINGNITVVFIEDNSSPWFIASSFVGGQQNSTLNLFPAFNVKGTLNLYISLLGAFSDNNKQNNIRMSNVSEQIVDTETKLEASIAFNKNLYVKELRVG